MIYVPAHGILNTVSRIRVGFIDRSSIWLWSGVIPHCVALSLVIVVCWRRTIIRTPMREIRIKFCDLVMVNAFVVA